MDVFLYFFEAKSPGKKLWMSFNGVAGRVLLSLFQQLYKGFKGKFFKIRCSKFDPTLLDKFPLYWVKEHELKKPRGLEDLTSHDREVCEFFSKLGVVFSTAELIKLEYNPGSLKGCIGIPPSPCLCLRVSLLVCLVGSYVLLSSYAEMVHNAEKRRQFVVVALQLRAALGPSVADASAPATSTPGPSAPAPVDLRPRLQEEEESRCCGSCELSFR